MQCVFNPNIPIFLPNCAEGLHFSAFHFCMYMYYAQQLTGTHTASNNTDKSMYAGNKIYFGCKSDFVNEFTFFT